MNLYTLIKMFKNDPHGISDEKVIELKTLLVEKMNESNGYITDVIEHASQGKGIVQIDDIMISPGNEMTNRVTDVLLNKLFPDETSRTSVITIVILYVKQNWILNVAENGNYLWMHC